MKGSPQGGTGATTAEPAAAGQADAKPAQQDAAKGRAAGPASGQQPADGDKSQRPTSTGKR